MPNRRRGPVPVHLSPRPLRAARRAAARTRLYRQAADRMFAVAVIASVAVLLRAADAVQQLAPLTLTYWK